MLKKIKTHTLINSAANNFITPYFSYVTARLSNSYIVVGYVQGLGLFNSMLQLLTGNLVDRKNNRINLILISSLLIAISCIALYYIFDPIILALIFTAIIALQGIYGGAYNALLGEISQKNNRGRFLSNFVVISEIGAIVAMLATIPLTYVTNSFRIAFIIGGILFIASSLVLLGTPEIKVKREVLKPTSLKSLRDFYFVNFTYGIFWGFAWPLFTITQVKILNMKPYEYVIAQVIGAISILAFQPLAGKMVDKDRRMSMFLGKFGLIVFPIGFYFSTSPIHIYLINALTGLISALVNVAYTAYLYDLAPEGYRGRFSAEFNLVNNTAAMIGSLSSTSLVDYISAFMPLNAALGIGYLIATIGRGSTSFMFFRFKSELDEKRLISNIERTS
ncbi:MAG TPA: MFS transporter [Geobacterales bacterium]|nr:MFS transporter [Geobacterales bacterium]